jgi:hypothetical protein
MEGIDIGIMIASVLTILFVSWVHKDRPEDNY